MSQGTTLAALEKFGPMTSEQIAEKTTVSKIAVDANLRRLAAPPWEWVVVVGEVPSRPNAAKPTKVWAVRPHD